MHIKLYHSREDTRTRKPKFIGQSLHILGMGGQWLYLRTFRLNTNGFHSFHKIYVFLLKLFTYTSPYTPYTLFITYTHIVSKLTGKLFDYDNTLHTYNISNLYQYTYVIGLAGRMSGANYYFLLFLTWKISYSLIENIIMKHINGRL